ncbi:MAG: hypothetical protein PHR21_02955 [Oscillospiraceae bacterium]|nr:hypothetical protein [Oscillospiraceae bacterium]MDD4367625.1 hypothetical protein [Oscillospiraceae bacterium]
MRALAQDPSGDLYFYPSAFWKKLDVLQRANTVALEAPSGYGKSTAVKDFLTTVVSETRSRLCWCTAQAGVPAEAYLQLCKLVEQLDPVTGRRLQKAGLPDSQNLTGLGELWQNFSSGETCFLVIDNFQQLAPVFPLPLFNAILERPRSGLHVVLISQFFPREQLALLLKLGVPLLNQADLAWSAADIQAYATRRGQRLTAAQAQELYRQTGGWVTAVSLYLRLRQDKRPEQESTGGILMLLEHAVWATLPLQQQTVLLNLSPFQQVTEAQLRFLNRELNPQADLRAALNLPLIRHDPLTHSYEIHELLSDLLQERRRQQEADFNRDCLRRAGDWCFESGAGLQAASLYEQAGDFRSVMKLDPRTFYHDRLNGDAFYRTAWLWSEHQGRDPALLRLQPLFWLRLAYLLLSSGRTEAFRQLLRRLFPLLDRTNPADRLLLADW